MRTEQELTDVFAALSRRRSEIIAQYDQYVMLQGVHLRSNDHDGLVTATRHLEEMLRDLEHTNKLYDVLLWVEGKTDYLPFR